MIQKLFRLEYAHGRIFFVNATYNKYTSSESFKNNELRKPYLLKYANLHI